MQVNTVEVSSLLIENRRKQDPSEDRGSLMNVNTEHHVDHVNLFFLLSDWLQCK